MTVSVAVALKGHYSSKMSFCGCTFHWNLWA